MGLECVVYMGETDIIRQEPNVKKMEMLGATVVPAKSGNKTLKDATNEALRDWICNPENTFYIIGSVVGPHPYPDLVAKFQSVISEELLYQLKEVEGTEDPDYILACVGGGSNAAGIFYHYLDRGKVKLIGVEAAGKGSDTSETAATISVGKTRDYTWKQKQCLCRMMMGRLQSLIQYLQDSIIRGLDLFMPG